MSKTTVRLDPQNPGQYYACCGLLEMCEQISPGCRAYFEPGDTSRSATFNVIAPADVDLSRCMKILREATISVLAEVGEHAVHPVRIAHGDFNIVLSFWLDWVGLKKTALKLWAGQQSGDGIVKDMKSHLPSPQLADAGLFEHGAPLKGRFGIDPRAAWLPIDCGFSPNELNQEVHTYPPVELLGAIGLQQFTLTPARKRDGYSYTIWTTPLQSIEARAVSMGAVRSIPGFRYRFDIVNRGSYKAFDYSEPDMEE